MGKVACLALLSCIPFFGQTLGEITGVITDSSGGAVAAAVVSVTNQGTNAVRTALTNEAGVYSFPSLVPGLYNIKVEKQGFRTITQTSIELQVQQTARMDFALQVGQITETVEVTASAPLLTTEDATVGTVIENKRHRRAASQRPQLSPTGGAQPQRELRFRQLRPVRQPTGRQPL
jgi:hypothetical protein